MLKKILITSVLSVGLLVLLAAGAFQWLKANVSSDIRADKNITPAQIAYIRENHTEQRGKILAVLTSVHEMGSSGKATGYELTELARAYYVFRVNGFDVDIASVQGGEPPAVIDQDDMTDIDYAFLNDPLVMNKVKQSIAIADVDPAGYDAVYFVGGKGTMFDFPDNAAIQQLVADMYENQKVIAAVCHGPVALINVRLSSGKYLLEGKTVSAFTNSEELTLIPDAEEVFPFLLQTALNRRNVNFVAGPDYVSQISVDGNLITGQNPWSVWQLAEEVIVKLGYTPVSRELTDEENAAAILKAFYQQGYAEAEAYGLQLIQQNKLIKRELIAVHGILALIKFEPGKMWQLFRLLHSLADPE